MLLDKCSWNEPHLITSFLSAAWILDVVDQLPSCATFVGTDYTSKWFPPNIPKSVSFSIQPIEEPWPPSWASSFDFVYQSLALSSCSTELARVAVGRLFRLVKPGGWIQLVECDNCRLFGPDVISEHPAISRFVGLVARCFAFVGRYEVHAGHRIPGWLEQAGALNITSKIIEIPVGCESIDPELGAITSINIIMIIKRLKTLLVGKGKLFPCPMT